MKIIELAKLNSSQEDAILRCLEAKDCYHRNTIKLIWGPPGTGKTKTSVLLLNLLKMRCMSMTLTCAPTNIAVLEVASRVVKLVSESLRFDGYGLGDIVLFGNKERMKIDEREDLYDVFLYYRVDELYHCFQAETGWRANAKHMISLLSDPKYVYHQTYMKCLEKRPLFKQFVEARLRQLRSDLQFHFSTLCRHLPAALLSFKVTEKMNRANDLLRYVTVSDVVANRKSCYGRLKYVVRDSGKENDILESDTRKQECVTMLTSICDSIDLPEILDKFVLKKICLANTFLLFCTASSSAKLHLSYPIQLLVVDEAAIRRSLFERLVLLGQKKELLNMQYMMHPSISIFPNREFYGMKILDAPSVRVRSYEKQ